MKKIMTAMGIGVIFFAVQVAAAAYLGVAPVIDGNLAEWEAAGTQYIYTDECLGGEQVGTGKLYMAFDDDNFYLAYDWENAEQCWNDHDWAWLGFNGGFWFPDASAYNSEDPKPSEFVLTDSPTNSVLERMRPAPQRHLGCSRAGLAATWSRKEASGLCASGHATNRSQVSMAFCGTPVTSSRAAG